MFDWKRISRQNVQPATTKTVSIAEYSEHTERGTLFCVFPCVPSIPWFNVFCRKWRTFERVTNHPSVTIGALAVLASLREP
jgi:hypothetical protein